ncbi:MAG: bifunctional phosphopantothenoylcysteine decarboxylase/phosphopantothenate--cysteine ligase CoaBC [Flavobacteriales bacterium]|jgi:phosphopantothenoylcysteine decarboxylase/phosphopantothenate--cysteine ligase|nr:bifunctional phosphopantothenoylcysteine decarboxylase/phosphopantothenate--cysteine ligase CoaBC [Flavobacteriales bacterium]MBK6883117.1 bifunctional phosphopantothenoylcysteine decarboxylase/phosphopantothenate--cysteine ligase CoaBC [Flavobacteriales bacterium]MBK7103154.1 bifunctional phosphopantothenoylcysteine decarboxylase/phosphopantothenate--cysteine ligase CoaBC [Flavobacteriales bacterium]MBK7112870.1 bifunctional phosphopantothenoylcysteine decarboxylase/phosphopantothenate--cyst
MVERFLHRKVLLGVSGSIAAYKAAPLVRALVQAGAEVQVVMTRAAHDFVTPLTLATLSGRPVLTELVSGGSTWNDHVHLARWADVFLIAPLSANTLSKMGHGQCDNLLLACYLSATCPVFVAPAMDLEMYRDASTHANLDLLRGRNVRTIGPESGELASGLIGEGRMTEPEDIVRQLHQELVGQSKLNGKRILISAGPTQEPIDPVRYISNRSSGKMGFALAEEAAGRGALVQLVTGPTAQHTTVPGIQRTDVVTAAQMAEACKAEAATSAVVIMSAAVADHRPAAPAEGKIKKKDGDLELRLEATEDILAWIGKNKTEGQLVVGFALETSDGLAHAQGKLERKNLDLIVLNSLEDAGAGFGHDTNKVTLLDRGTKPQQLPLMSKKETARAILDRIEECL